MKEKITFSFGENWQEFLKSVNEERFRNARASITEFLGSESLEGKSFLDVGCGSGLFSHAAFSLGARKIVSFDIDPFSVECCKYMHKNANSPKNWEIYQGSILDHDFISQLGAFDIVYSWGVLHHTGKMWEAIKNSAGLVCKGGFYYIAIYNKVDGMRGSIFWVKIKKLYNACSPLGKHVLEATFILRYFVGQVIRLRNPLANIRNYKSHRGMNWRTDIKDWLGGYPYEFATVEEIFRFIRAYFPDFDLINIRTTNSLGNNWFLFHRM